MASKLAIFGGKPSVQSPSGDLFTWPIVTTEDETAVLDVLRHGKMSDIDITLAFEQDFRTWQGTEYALACNTGTAALHSAMFAVGLGVGDELICPSITYWASALQAFSLGASAAFADIDPFTLCIDPTDIERHITDATKAIMVVHYVGYPADMDAILHIADKHNLAVIEDVSHAHGGMYKGRKLGTFGHVAAMSLMSGKSFPAGEGGMLVTDDQEIYERALAFGHYRRFQGEGIKTTSLLPYRGLPLGGQKYRMNQFCSAMGRVQIKHNEERSAEIRNAINLFWDLLSDVPGLRAHRVPADSGSDMAGWYSATGHYVPSELGDLSVTRFAQAVRAEGSDCYPGINLPLHLHPLLNDADVYRHGKPTRNANSQRDLRQPPGSLPVAERIGAITYKIPQFKRYYPDKIAEHADAFRKVALTYQELLDDDPGNPPGLTSWIDITNP